MKSDPWPFPHENQLERARRIARSYRTFALSLDPAGVARLDDKAEQLGQGWVKPFESDVLDLDEALTAQQVSELIAVDPRTIRMWGYRGHIETLGKDGQPLYRLRDVLDYAAKTRRKSGT